MTQETDNKAASLRRRVLGAPNRYWSLGDLDDPSEAELRELSRLVKAGELVRVRRGLYWRGIMTPFGMSPPPESTASRAIVGDIGSGPSGGSAASELGLSTQVPAVMTVATPRRTTRPSGVAVEFVSRPARTGRLLAKLRAADVALLEVLESWNETVDASPANAIARIRELVASGNIDLERVVRASTTESATVRARLKALLEALDEAALANRVPRARTPRVSSAAERIFRSTA